MIELNLQTNNKEQEAIKEYLQNNVSELLADKINNGVKITKDNKTLINKKDLVGFMKYATEEARKQVEKGANSACIHSDIVFGWAMHYFEEDAIEGILYNEDGTEYKSTNKTETKTTSNIPKVEPKKETNAQTNLFDLMLTNDNCNNENNEIKNTYDNELQNKNYKNIEKTIKNSENIEKMQEKCEKIENNLKIPKYYQEYCEKEMSYPQAIILIRMGDFYEAYNQNAERIADVLDLVLTSKDIGLENKIKLAGFPVHIKDKYIDKLNERYSIVILENGTEEYIEQKQSINEKQNDNASKQEIEQQESQQTFDKYLLKRIATLLDGKVIIQ